MQHFQANCLSTLIGSLPMKDHVQATQLVLQRSPDIPLWVQLPAYKEEGMIPQFIPGFPGLTVQNGKELIDSQGEAFEESLLAFYEAYMQVTEENADIGQSMFAMTPATAKGFFEFISQVQALSQKPLAVKGQITGPFTFGTSVTDVDERAVFYDDRLKDAAIKLLAMKAKWQVNQLKALGLPVILFLDEPALAGFGSSAFISISQSDVVTCLNEVIEAVQAEGGLTGVHVCANTEWSLLTESKVDIISFDAYAYFDKFLLYKDQVKAFLERGGILAQGIVPTAADDIVAQESTATLFDRWLVNESRLVDLGIEKERVRRQSLITPSCGTGTLTLANAEKVLKMTSELSNQLRAEL